MYRVRWKCMYFPVRKWCIILYKDSRYEEKLNRKGTRPKYANVDSINKKFKGWDRKCIKRFNILVHATKNNREHHESKEIEIEIRLTYNKLCGRPNDNNSGSNSSGSEDSDSGDIEAYHGFF